MFGVSLLEGLVIGWAVVTGIAIVLLIYRSTLGAHEEDKLCLTRGTALHEEQNREVIRKEGKLAPFLYVLGTMSVVLLLSVVGTWIWQGLLRT